MELYLESYRRHNLETKQMTSSECVGGYQWAWQTFNECMVTEAEVAGYLTGAVSLLLLSVSWVLVLVHVYTVTARALWTILIFGAFIDTVSFVGAVLSMQMMLLILSDLASVAISLFLLVPVSGVVLARRYSKNDQYRTVCDGHFATPAPKSLLGVTSYRVCILPVCLVLAALVVSLTTSLQRWSGATTSSAPGASMEIKHIVVMTTLGYTLGCVACFGRWALELMVMKFTMPSAWSSRVWQGGGAAQLLSDVTYILGVLLQSGGVNVTLTTLPWLTRRVLQASFQVYKFKSTKWAESCFIAHPQQAEKSGQTGNGDDDDEVIDIESATLLAGSESETSEAHVLYDRRWKIPDQQNEQVRFNQEEPTHKRVPPPFLQNDCAAVAPCYCVASTTESDWTSTSQEQELAWDHGEVVTSQDHARERPFRHLCQTARPQQESKFTLDFTSSETYTERVISWISKSTPEEETPPCLTLTLNLDSSHVDRNSEAEMNYGERKFYYGGMLLSPRKNSF
ncbi:unnamed protein product [Lymnaea stagnalis]|uniref:Uncharacterized protein n=1 Tax=Lymnaea stagnalis TaxID=6523 RepID=A0AAV2ID69_LYMST